MVRLLGWCAGARQATPYARRTGSIWLSSTGLCDALQSFPTLLNFELWMNMLSLDPIRARCHRLFCRYPDENDNRLSRLKKINTPLSTSGGTERMKERIGQDRHFNTLLRVWRYTCRVTCHKGAGRTNGRMSYFSGLWCSDRIKYWRQFNWLYTRLCPVPADAHPVNYRKEQICFYEKEEDFTDTIIPHFCILWANLLWTSSKLLSLCLTSTAAVYFQFEMITEACVVLFEKGVSLYLGNWT